MTATRALRLPLRVEPGLHDGPRRTGRVVQRDPAGAPSAFGGFERGEYWIRFPNLATFAFSPGAEEIRVQAASGKPQHVVESLYRTAVVPAALQTAGYEAVHGSGVQTELGVIVLCGLSGTGKTTLAYGLARRGFPLWADDVVVFAAEPSAPATFASPRLEQALNLRAPSREHFGVAAEGDPHVDVAHADADILATVIVLDPDPRAEVELVGLPLSAALTAILPHAHCYFVDEGREEQTVRAFLNLAAQVPVLRLRYPGGFDRLDAVLDAIEEHLRGTGAGR